MKQLPKLPRETAESISRFAIEENFASQWKTHYFQMLDFVSLVQERGGPLLDAELLRAEYQRRLDAAIATLRIKFAG